jgi:hypothetical protein
MKTITLTLLLLLITTTASAQQCCQSYPEATTDANGLTYVTINGGEYAGFQADESDGLIWTRSFKVWLWNPGVYQFCATYENNGSVCKTCIFYEWDTINSRQADCINPEWIDTTVTYTFGDNTVCGCDGVEYKNEWSARLSGVTRYADGPCCFSDSTTVTENINPIIIQGVKVYPNPATDQITVSANQLELITMYDTAGRLLQRIECYEDKAVIEINMMVSGCYFLGVQSAGKTKYRSITKSRL